jgi:hypothetical protein
MMRGGFTGGPGMMGNPVMMRMIFALIDTDGDGTIELQEFQAAYERLFKAMDTNKDGRLTLEDRPSCREERDRPNRDRWSADVGRTFRCAQSGCCALASSRAKRSRAR